MPAFLRSFCFALPITLLLGSCLGLDAQSSATPNSGRHDRDGIVTALSSYDRIQGLANFGDPNAERFFNHLALLEKPGQKTGIVRILQFGDSHTAADFFSGSLRLALQHRFGTAGIGWIPPITPKGQRHTQAYSTASGWELISSRTAEHPDFPMGGFLARPIKKGGVIHFSSRNIEEKIWQAHFLIKRTGSEALVLRQSGESPQALGSHAPFNQWVYVEKKIRFPFTITASHPNSAELGGVWIEDPDAKGVILSPVAFNGARQISWQRWSSTWTRDLAQSKADLIILAYGVNEGFSKNLNQEEMRQSLEKGILLIRSILPKAAILIIGAPDAMIKSSSGLCSERQPLSLEMARKIQFDVARRMKTLYWDWRAIMGGACGIALWEKSDLARGDLVHMTEAGYRLSADQLYYDILYFTRNKR